jgi:hypothetical protein
VAIPPFGYQPWDRAGKNHGPGQGPIRGTGEALPKAGSGMHADRSLPSFTLSRP